METPDHFVVIAERVVPGAKLRASRRLTGGVSADVHSLELEGPDGHRRTVVVRQHGAAAWKPLHEQVTVLEYGLLQFLHRAGWPVPEPLLLDTTGESMPGPFFVMSFVEGSPDVAEGELGGRLDVMAATLARLHALPTDDVPDLPERLDPLPELFDYLTEGGELPALREALARRTDTRYTGRPALLHGDFWPGNLLWQDGRLVAILDWEDAALGDPMCDVAGCRIELLWKYDMEAVTRFTESYAQQRALDAERLALWEVYVASAGAHFMGEWGLEPEREADMRTKAEAFVQAAARTLLRT